MSIIAGFEKRALSDQALLGGVYGAMAGRVTGALMANPYNKRDTEKLFAKDPREDAKQVFKKIKPLLPKDTKLLTTSDIKKKLKTAKGMDKYKFEVYKGVSETNAAANPETNEIITPDKVNPSILAHEAGHLIDNDDIKKSPFWKRFAKKFRSQVSEEATAWDKAPDQETIDQEVRDLALGTYKRHRNFANIGTAAGAIIGGVGGAALHKFASGFDKQANVRGMIRGMLPPKKGYTRVYHGTSAANADKIMKEGLKPNVGGGVSEVADLTNTLTKANKDLVFTSKRKAIAKTYARNQHKIENINKMMHGKQSPVDTIKNVLFRPAGKTIKMDIPNTEIAKRMRDNPEIAMLRENTEGQGKIKKFLADKYIALGHGGDVPLKGGVDPKYIVGTSAHMPEAVPLAGKIGGGLYINKKWKDHRKKKKEGLQKAASGDMIEYFMKHPKKREEYLARKAKKQEKKAFWAGFDKQAYLKKRPYSEADIKSLSADNSDEVWTAKIDGAHTVVDMKKGKTPQLFSHRLSKKSGGTKSYNPLLNHIKNKSQVNATLRVETYAVDKSGKSIEPSAITGILNSKPEKAQQTLKDMKVKTKTALIDIDTYEGKDVSKLPFSEKSKLLKEVAKKHKDFHLPATATTPKAKKKLLDQILSGDHPQTKEGLIVHKGDKEKFIKAKVTKDHDVYVRRIFKETNTKAGRAPMAGGFWYSWTPDGAPVGKVGTGFSHTLKKDMLLNPEKYIGRAARVKAQDLSKNKVLTGSPRLLGWHVEKNIGRMDFGPDSVGRTDAGLNKELSKTLSKNMLKNHEYKKQTVIINKRIASDRESAKAIARGFADRLYTARETGQSYRFRQLNPNKFDPKSYKTFKPQEGVSVVYGKLKASTGTA